MLLDTSVVIEVLRHIKTSKEFKLIQRRIGEEELYVFVVQLAELSDWCFANDVPVRERVEEVKKLANIIPLDEDICLEGSRIKNERRKKGFRSFGLVDGFLLAAARSVGERLLTFDRDFAEEQDCLVLP
ncbi:type II toxin-antitoxin system VapC family toxin [Candidatus Bathyarchaeota archaeon]|nr:MAG: type II toxin-antitoxin system VapC family toxin [Candidatus Bathyarchaeota archaeon]TMI32073.1 MAG: type II toxin-antitoxin system VapC family toxin [Candidatus Bathyarchaeota archaeon]